MSMLLAALLMTGDINRIDAPMSSGELTDICSANSEASVKACALYLRGAFEAVLLTESALNGGYPLFCLPQKVTLSDIRDNFVEQTENDPSLRDVEAGITLLASLETTYPCDSDEMDDQPVTLAAEHHQGGGARRLAGARPLRAISMADRHRG
jgi:hypothetical protein